MINRVLIRIKVIQTLYSFLLVEKQFTLESSPSNPTKEKRFAYSLYLDMLAALVKVAEMVKKGSKEYPLLSTRFISRLLLDDTVKSLLSKYNRESFPLQQALPGLAEKVAASAVYENYLKDLKKSIVGGEEMLWPNLFNLVVMADPALNSLFEQYPNYSPKGVERMKEMMNRTFRNFLASQDNLREVEGALSKSLDMARELYMRLLHLPVEITALQEQILDDNRYKYFKTEEDVNPNLRFVNNGLVKLISENEGFMDYVENNHLSWMAEDPVLVRSLLTAITESETYREYMEAPSTDLHRDTELWRDLFKKVILDNTAFLEALEEKSVFWNDDLEIISTFVLKSMRKAEEEGSDALVMEKFKDKEDERFGSELLRFVYKNKDTYRPLLEETLRNGKWEADRIAFMDMVILQTALAEIMNFPKIPLVASINEYIELAKSYSSQKSGSFVNGVLATVVSRLQREGKLHKK